MSTTWPPDWTERVRGKDCPMCAQGRPDEDEWGVRVLAGRFSDAYLQRASWQPGYTIVVWRGRHVAEPTELRDEEAVGDWREVLRVASAIERRLRPGAGAASAPPPRSGPPPPGSGRGAPRRG